MLKSLIIKIAIGLALSSTLFANCSMHMVIVNSSLDNAADYAMKGNDKYELIETKEAVTYLEYALTSCKGIKSDTELRNLSKKLSTLKKTKSKLERKRN